MEHNALKPLFNEIVDAIHEKDGLSDGIAAKDFPERIREIPAVRPADWLELPEPVDDEMYLLVHIPEGGSESLGFTVTCTGEYTVELGTVAYQLFVPESSQTATSGAAYGLTLMAESYGNPTSTGMMQAVIRITGTGIKTWSPASCNGVVEIKCRLPKGTSLKAGGNLPNMRFFTWRGKNSINSAVRMFANSASLLAIEELDMSSITSVNSIFIGCSSLKRLPQFNSSNIKDMTNMFHTCSSLTTIPKLSTRNAGNMNTIFYRCLSLESVVFDPTVSDWPGCNFSIASCNFSRDGLVKLFESLPAITEPHTLTITGNPGVSELTEEDKAIATEKNWALSPD